MQKKSDGQAYTLKVIKRELIVDSEIEKLQVNPMLKAEHSFLVATDFIYSTETKLYLVNRFVRGGELFHQMRNSADGRFKENAAKFYAI